MMNFLWWRMPQISSPSSSPPPRRVVWEQEEFTGDFTLWRFHVPGLNCKINSQYAGTLVQSYTGLSSHVRYRSAGQNWFGCTDTPIEPIHKIRRPGLHTHLPFLSLTPTPITHAMTRPPLDPSFSHAMQPPAPAPAVTASSYRQRMPVMHRDHLLHLIPTSANPLCPQARQRG
jgi:hypothetical protein